MENIRLNLSWKLTKNLDDEKHQLFYNQVKTYYEIEGYCCACGHEEILLKSSEKWIQYSCPKCDNEIFYNANLAHKSFDSFIEEHHDNPNFENYYYYHETKKSALDYLEKCNLPIEYEYAIVNDDSKIISSYRTLDIIPKSIDYARKRIISEPIDLYAFTLHHHDGSTAENYCMQYDYQMFATLKRNLNQYINAHKNSFSMPPTRENLRLSYKDIVFFTKYHWLKEFDFCLWEDVNQLPKEDATIQSALDYLLKGRSEKSIKKALYENYYSQLETYDCFKSTLINTIIETIKDPNFIAKLFRQNLHCEAITVTEENYLKQLIFFLQKHYSEKQIASFLQNIDEPYLLMDLLREFIYMRENIEELFTKTKCTLRSLHDEFVECSMKNRNSQLFNENITYLHGQAKAKAKIFHYYVKLPHTGAELLEWAEDLHNCLSGFFEEIRDNKTTVYGFFNNDAIEFAVEVANKRIRQASGVCNKKLTDTQNEALKTWFDRFIVNAQDTGIYDNTVSLEEKAT